MPESFREPLEESSLAALDGALALPDPPNPINDDWLPACALTQQAGLKVSRSWLARQQRV